MTTIEEMLTTLIDMHARIGHPALLERFVLRNGRLGIAQPRPSYVKRGKPKLCFMNASQAMLYGLDYHEGFVLRDSLPLAIHHAWVQDGDRVIDPTLSDAEHCQYIGVLFSPAAVYEQQMRLGIYGLLDTGVGANTALIYARDPELRAIAEAVIKTREPFVL
jgi:hypothetical protein